ncbi:MAG: sulfite oxidase-like oxidoreductase [Chloroflexi bacterium]|nr:MAG: sulfite oxidase-like oxidoreductase [Chloroflexota bacterium]
MGFISRGFRGKRRDTADSGRLPPGQYLVNDYPVLSAGPTPRPNLDTWTFSIEGEIDTPKKWTWQEFLALPAETVTKDIHCVTKWSKFDTTWKGVSFDTLFEGVETAAEYTTQFSDGDYTTNLPLEDLVDGKAWIVYEYNGEPLHPEHGGPARMLVPHLYFWKSAKWIRGVRLDKEQQPGFWETNGYNNYGDPWREQRYWGD